MVLSRKVFDEAASVGFELSLLDVGGGFPGSSCSSGDISFQDIAAVLGPIVDSLFPPHVRVIAEPGRFFVSAAFTLAVNVTSRRQVEDSYM